MQNQTHFNPNAISSSVRPTDATEQTLAVGIIQETVRGAGHFYQHPETFARIKSYFTYPNYTNRQSPEAWKENCEPNISKSAREAVRTLVSTHLTDYIPQRVYILLRERFNICLPLERMVLSD